MMWGGRGRRGFGGGMGGERMRWMMRRRMMGGRGWMGGPGWGWGSMGGFGGLGAPGCGMLPGCLFGRGCGMFFLGLLPLAAVALGARRWARRGGVSSG
jgi:hypothetical protein